MANRRCPKCGEEYSDTYRSCPFCEEEDAIKHGKKLHRHTGRRVEKRPGRNSGAGGVMLLLTMIVIAGVVGYVFFGDDIAEAVGIRANQDPAPISDQSADKVPAADKTNRPAPTVPDPSGSSAEPVIPDSAEPVEPGTPLTLSQSDITIPAGETGRLTASGGTGDLVWSSSNPEIASVDGGSITGKAGGTVTITATSGEETASCTVKVEGDPWVNPNASSFQLSKTDFTLSSSENSWQLKIKRDESTGWEVLGSADGVTWATNNASVATISDTGLVSRAGKGNTQITATIDGVTLECIVRMK